MSDSEEEPKPALEDPGDGRSKFDELMKAACHIKGEQLAQKRRKFELMSSFMKAGVYYTKKLGTVRKQCYPLKKYVYDLIIKDASQDFKKKEHDRACRKYEEALSIWFYYHTDNPKWDTEGIDDDQIFLVEDKGNNEKQRQEIIMMRLTCLLNIAACNLKAQEFKQAALASEDALRLDADNFIAIYRRAKALAMPINSGVEEYLLAIKDLKRVVQLIDCPLETLLVTTEKERAQLKARSLKEIQYLTQKVQVNRKREYETYGKMFTKQAKVQEEVEKKVEQLKKEVPVIRSQAIIEKENEIKMINKLTRRYIRLKNLTFQFETKKNKSFFPEVAQLEKSCMELQNTYFIFKKGGKFEEAKMVLQKLIEAKYHKHHLETMLNQDYERPTAKALEDAKKSGIDLKDPIVIDEFKRLLETQIEDLRRVRQGLKPLTDEEIKERTAKKREEAMQRMMAETGEKRQKMLERAQKENEELQKKVEQSQADSKHYFVVAAFLFIWVAFIWRTNFN